LAIWDDWIKGLRNFFGIGAPPIPPPAFPGLPIRVPRVEEWIQFVYTVTFIATRDQRLQKKTTYRNIETGQVFRSGEIDLRKKEHRDMIRGWEADGVLVKTEAEVLRKIEGHFTSYCTRRDYPIIQERLVQEAYQHILRFLKEESSARQAQDEARGLPKEAQQKIIDYTFIFSDPQRNLLHPDNSKQKREAESAFSELRDYEAIESWQAREVAEPGARVDTLADLRDVTYDRLIFNLRTNLPREWVTWTPAEVGDELMRRG